MTVASDEIEPSIVIFDLDGTLADVRHRLHFVEEAPKRWSEFNAACVDDTVHFAAATAFRAYRESGYELWICTGRSDEVRKQTKAWLKENDLQPNLLMMRRARDHQPDDRLKRSWLLDGSIPRDRVVCVYDDRGSVCTMWRREGLTCFQVAGES